MPPDVRVLFVCVVARHVVFANPFFLHHRPRVRMCVSIVFHFDAWMYINDNMAMARGARESVQSRRYTRCVYWNVLTKYVCHEAVCEGKTVIGQGCGSKCFTLPPSSLASVKEKKWIQIAVSQKGRKRAVSWHLWFLTAESVSWAISFSGSAASAFLSQTSWSYVHTYYVYTSYIRRVGYALRYQIAYGLYTYNFSVFCALSDGKRWQCIPGTSVLLIRKF